MGLSRRALLRGGGTLGVALLVPLGRPGAPAGAVALRLDAGLPGFLTDRELSTLAGLVDRFVPGPPEDPDPGAVDAGCVEAIDALLAAFVVDPPRIYAGGPFSDRGGAARNDFAEFIPLDRYEATAWRLRIEGSRGRAELEFNGPVKGYQQLYREGLAALDEAVPGGRFADLPAPARELILRTTQDPAITRLVDVAFLHTLELMYGAPEYGGNRDLVAWEYARFDGDVQPRGYTREQVENPDDPGLAELLRQLPPGVSLSRLTALAPLASVEAWHGVTGAGGGTLSGLQAALARILEGRDGR